MKIRPIIPIFYSTFFFLLFSLSFLTNSVLKKTPPHTFLLQKDYSHLTLNQVRAALKSDFSLPATLTLKHSSAEFTLPSASLSALIDYSATAQKLFFKFNPRQPLFRQLKHFFTVKNFILTIDYDPISLDARIATFSSGLYQPFIPTALELVTVSGQKQIEVKAGSLGLSVDQPALKQTIIDHLSYLTTDPLIIPVQTTGSLPDPSQITLAASRAQKLIGKSLLLTGDFDDVAVDDQTIVSWISSSSDFNSIAIKEFSQNLSDSLSRDPVNAIFKFANNQVSEFRPSRDGLTVLTDDLAPALQTSTANLIATDSSSLSLSVPVKKTSPLIKTPDANNLGIKELLGRGTSTFKHSSSIRNHNIQKGSSVINHLLVPPGDNFSFLKALGPVTLDRGYQKAYIIREGRTELDLGGGICQVSTTFFRAMLNSGVEILERHPHAFRVSYYEEDRPPGYDATVFIPSPDLRFKNDTPAHILIQSIYDDTNKVLTYEFYGTSDGRKIEISNYKKFGWQPPPPTIYIDDPTLAPGKLVREETAVAGIKTSFDWIVNRDDQVLHQKTFYSSYVPWAAVFRRGI